MTYKLHSTIVGAVKYVQSHWYYAIAIYKGDQVRHNAFPLLGCQTKDILTNACNAPGESFSQWCRMPAILTYQKSTCHPHLQLHLVVFMLHMHLTESTRLLRRHVLVDPLPVAIVSHLLVHAILILQGLGVVGSLP